MKCLYCRNELALLKKLTGGGEFCSDAHRQRYQQEYDRLALTRLLQTQSAPSPSDPRTPRGGSNGAAEPAPRVNEGADAGAATDRETPLPIGSGLRTQTVPSASAISHIAAEEKPFEVKVSEPPAPPSAGFVKFEITPLPSVGRRVDSDGPLAKKPGVTIPVWTVTRGAAG
ncbi:MAG: hypothetical protein ABI165_21555, partial [Bryobacteraceae bacterium]